ncbi:hypothetical protein C823_002430 [Eubacterium plexicaudatum ASF492]|nr:hypothetical protein C823_002430 [Eubacterium plexicaudatum ASF492]
MFEKGISEYMKAESKNSARCQIDRLDLMFPDCMIKTMDSQGRQSKAIDLERLYHRLSDFFRQMHKHLHFRGQSGKMRLRRHVRLRSGSCVRAGRTAFTGIIRKICMWKGIIWLF